MPDTVSCYRKDKPWDQKVKIGQIVHADRGVVEFVATTGKRTVGHECFQYEAQDRSEEDYSVLGNVKGED